MIISDIDEAAGAGMAAPWVPPNTVSLRVAAALVGRLTPAVGVAEHWRRVGTWEGQRREWRGTCKGEP